LKISEVIAELAGIQAEHGDLDVYISKDDEGNSITNYSDAAVWLEDEEDPESKYNVILFRGYTDLPGREGW
jgi:hypothetical protein